MWKLFVICVNFLLHVKCFHTCETTLSCMWTSNFTCIIDAIASMRNFSHACEHFGGCKGEHVKFFQNQMKEFCLCISHIEAWTSPPPGIPSAFDTFAVPGRRELDYQSLPWGGEFDPHTLGVGNLNCTLHFMWNLWRGKLSWGTRC